LQVPKKQLCGNLTSIGRTDSTLLCLISKMKTQLSSGCSEEHSVTVHLWQHFSWLMKYAMPPFLFPTVSLREWLVLKITPKGDLQRYPFEYTDYTPLGKCVRWDYGMYYDTSDYIDDLKSVAAYQGYSPEDIDSLLDNGFAPEEIEEYIYCMGEV